MKYNSSYEQSLMVNNGGSVPSAGNPAVHFQLEPSSVIKTAPPGHLRQQSHQQSFSPKHEPIDLAPLTQPPSLQDLSKMQPAMEHYAYMPSAAVTDCSRVYDYLSGGAGYQVASPQIFPNAAAAVASAAFASNIIQQQQQSEWRSQLEHPYITYQRATPSSSSTANGQNGGQNGHYAHNGSHPQSHLSHAQHQQQSATGALVIVDSVNGQRQHTIHQAQQQQHEHHRLYKALNGELLSPVDSGIGADLSMLEGQPSYALVASSIIQQQQQPATSVIATHPQHLLGNGLAAIGAVDDITQAMMEVNREGAGSGGSHREAIDTPLIIPKIENSLGFQYTLEAPISTSIRREDDRMTYVNKGQFYTISLDYIPELSKPLKGHAVKSQVIIGFRDNKSQAEEINTWQMWHKRQHTYKQRILEVDAKNSVGIIGQIEEVALNAVQFCWSPNEQPGAKISIAVQCLSTDFSTQKGVKGLPLHVQIDTYDEADDTKIPFHRGYCQIKVFCDKGANRKMLHENRRDQRRRCGMQLNGGPANGLNGVAGQRKKAEGEFHDPCERSPFYHMIDLDRPAAFFVPPDDYSDTRYLDSTSLASYETLSELEPLPKRPKPTERIMIYVREQEDEEHIFTPLHLMPPTLAGLSAAICEKYHLDEKKIGAFYKQCLKGGVTVRIDDDMLRHYTNQDTFLINIKSRSDDPTTYTVTLVELSRHEESPSPPRPSIIGSTHGASAIYHSSAIQHHP